MPTKEITERTLLVTGSQKSETPASAKGKLNNRTITPLRAGLGAAGAATIAIAAAIFTTPGAIPALLTLAASGPIGWGIIGLGAVTALGVIAVAGVIAYLGTEVLIERNQQNAMRKGLHILKNEDVSANKDPILEAEQALEERKKSGKCNSLTRDFEKNLNIHYLKEGVNVMQLGGPMNLSEEKKVLEAKKALEKSKNTEKASEPLKGFIERIKNYKEGDYLNQEGLESFNAQRSSDSDYSDSDVENLQ